ncbi:MAG: ABC transporter ATP-binding protein [Candidatus Omnitrophica bacterium]|nr:ABC transporter ATP-binding protein [Candidatus Omnitrophota bacterium]
MLQACNIHKSFIAGKKNVPVLKGVNISVNAAEFVAIVGPSGAGKSTLLHILGALDSPDQGQVVFEGQDLFTLSDRLVSRVRNERIGFVFQFYHLLSEFTVLENVLMPIRIGAERIKDAARAKDKARRLLAEVGLQERMTHFPAQLSGGEKQRVALVRGLMNSPRVLLCDEPTGNLDSKTGEEIVTLIQRLGKENRMAVVLVTHNQELVKRVDTLYHLRDGMLVN